MAQNIGALVKESLNVMSWASSSHIVIINEIKRLKRKDTETQSFFMNTESTEETKLSFFSCFPCSDKNNSVSLRLCALNIMLKLKFN